MDMIPTARQDSVAEPPAAASARGLLPLLLGALALAAVLMGLHALALRLPELAWLAELRRSGLIGLQVGALLIAAAGLAATFAVAAARVRAGLAPRTPTPRGRLLRRLPQRLPAHAGRAARWPQAWLIPPIALAGAACAWLLRPVGGPPVSPEAAYLLGGAQLVVAFGLLIVERSIAVWPAARLPEAGGLRILAMVPLGAALIGGLLELAVGAGLPFVRTVGTVAALILVAVGVELSLRALGRLFLPAPPAEAARAVVTSTIATLLVEGVEGGGIAAPIRRQFGIDFSRSWALSYVRAALPHVLLLLALLGWAATGLVSVGSSERAIEERLGAPVAMLAPGLHAIPPWPFAAVRRVEFGPLHELALGTLQTGTAMLDAEAVPSSSEDRLWEQAHPAELTMVIASPAAGVPERQSFQIMAADLRVFWRVGLSDGAALAAAYGVEDPPALLRSQAGHVAARYFATRTLASLLVADRAAIAADLRAALQAAVDRTGAGIEIAAVAVEAVHPPAEAAASYHNVQAAEIESRAQISAELGRAEATLASNRRSAIEAVTTAQGDAADRLSAARSDALAFDAERDAASAPLILEKRLRALGAVLANVPVTIIDDRLTGANAPVLDLRPPGARGTPGSPPND